MNSVLITGTNRGIGLGLVKSLLGSKNVPKYILATCRRPAEATELQQIADSHKNVHILEFDGTKFSSYPSLVQKVSEVVEEDGLNVLINNAGIGGGKFVRIGLVKPENMIESFIVNTVSPTILTKELVPLLRKAADRRADLPLGPHRATILNISSILGSIADNSVGGYYPYRCSKSALNCVTRSLSADLKPYNILAVSLHPGWVRTDMGGPKAPLEVTASADAIVSTLLTLGPQHNGAFLNHDGSPLPW